MSFLKRFFSKSNVDDLPKHWAFYKDWLHKKLPLYHSYLNPGATEQDIQVLKSNFKFDLPEELIQLYKLNNGDTSCDQELPLGSFMQFEFLSISRLIEEHKRYSDIIGKHPDLSKADHHRSHPGNVVKRMEFNAKWIPIFTRVTLSALTLIPTATAYTDK